MNAQCQKKQHPWRSQSGQSLIEYVILVALIALVSVSATKLLGRKLNTKINEMRQAVDDGIPVRLSPP